MPRLFLRRDSSGEGVGVNRDSQGHTSTDILREEPTALKMSQKQSFSHPCVPSPHIIVILGQFKVFLHGLP